MLKTTLKWARLAPLPESIHHLEVHKEGSPLTRAFRVSFEAEQPAIKNWLSDSPGIATAQIETLTSSAYRFLIDPANGAEHAEVLVDEKRGRVEIYVYWS